MIVVSGFVVNKNNFLFNESFHFDITEFHAIWDVSYGFD